MNDFWLQLESHPLAGEIGATALFPLMESLHVLSICVLLGAIVMVDLRVLGLAALRYPVRIMVGELVPWAAWAFLAANITGLAMFITRASAHVQNPAFQIKMALLLLAGLNIALFHFRAFPAMIPGEKEGGTALMARLTAGLSLLLWCAVMLAGRWVGHVV
ncbi:MAG: hypothetical protein RL572_705 [Pseudomonadota bacterium]